jgi:hypothetical protein
MNPDLCRAFVNLINGGNDHVENFRVINDRDAAASGINISGHIEDILPQSIEKNTQGYGVFMSINALDGRGFKLENISYIRAHMADLDNVHTSHDGYMRACASPCPPHAAVETSPNKYHLYWLTEPYVGNEAYSLIQRKLAQLYDGDKSIVDATRVMRMPGFYHCKGEPHLATCWQIHNGPRYTYQQLADSLAAVNVIEHHGTRSPLGTPEMAAPSLEWLVFALDQLFDPSDMDRGDWLGITCAFKQAGWSLADEQTLLKIWLDWCAKYPKNDVRENMKLWNSIHDSEVGWSRFERLSHVKAYMLHGSVPDRQQLEEVKQAALALPPAPVVDDERPANLPGILDAYGKQVWFKGCYFVEREGRIFTPKARFMNATQFNGSYGGKEFTLKDAGSKTTDEPWKAALRAVDWQIPKVDHTRFLPLESPGSVVLDELGRKGLNVYVPPRISSAQGDISLWFDFLSRIFNTHDDMMLFDSYIAHCIKFPGFKIPWGVLLQSAEGIGKQIIAQIIKYCVGETYTYEPKAEELVSGASRFNAWMKEKTLIVVDEIRVGDRRDLLEGLKKIITDKRIAVEGKGVDQAMEDNVANWLFFSNYKDAIPITENQRRYCVFFSKLQSARAIEEAGMDKVFFDRLVNWLNEHGGYAAMAFHFINHPIQRGSLSHRAPRTSSYDEVIRIGRSPLDILIDERLASGERGFRNGYLSWPLLMKAIAASKMRSAPPEFVIEQALENRGYRKIGFTPFPIVGEDISRPSLIFAINGLTVENYDLFQGM